MKRFLLLLLLLFAASAQAELPPLIPREVLFGNPQRIDPQISPDGSQLSWLAPDKNGVLNVWVSAIEGASPHPVTNEPGYPIHYYGGQLTGNTSSISTTITATKSTTFFPPT